MLGRSPAAFRAGVAGFLSQQTVALDDTDAAVVSTLLRQEASTENYHVAQSVLARSRNYRDRSVAALLLAPFPDEQDTWEALLDAMRETDGMVKDWASQALNTIAANNRRAPNWRRLAPTVHAMLDGTSLFMLQDVIEVLGRRPEIGPALAGPFLAGGGEMLVNFAESAQLVRAAPARALLTKLHGTDLGPSGATWRTWIKSLKR